MKFGFVLSWGDTTQILNLAQEAEDCGWDGVFTWDGVSIGDSPMYDPWVLMGAIAAVTERVTIGAMILPLARRRPWKVAKEAMTIDRISGGRLVLPVGLGVPEDRAFSGVNTDAPDRKSRAEKLDECLEILRLGERGEVFDYHGKHYQVDQMKLLPTPVNGHIPVWSVGAWPLEKSLARAIRNDGLIVADHTPGIERTAPMPPERMVEVAAWVREHRAAETPFDLCLEGRTVNADDTDYAAAMAAAGVTWFIESRWNDDDTPESLLERVRMGPPSI